MRLAVHVRDASTVQLPHLPLPFTPCTLGQKVTSYSPASVGIGVSQPLHSLRNSRIVEILKKEQHSVPNLRYYSTYQSTRRHIPQDRFHRQMRAAFFCAVTQRVVVISYRRFGTTYRSRLQELIFLTHEVGTDRLSRNVGKKLPLLAA